MAAVLAVGGAALIHDLVQTTHDRLLDGSLLAIAERIGVEEGEVSVDLPPAALGMLESQAQDSIYYSVRYQDTLVTGYPDLPFPDLSHVVPGARLHWSSEYKGHPVRLATEVRRLYGKPFPVSIEVAETTLSRVSLERQMLAALALVEVVLIAAVAFLGWRAVDRGLRPLTELGKEIDSRAVRHGIVLEPLDLSGVPREALAPAVALNTLLKRLKQSVAAIQRFTGDASHQILTPLAVIQTHLDLVDRHGSHTAAGRSALGEIGNAIRRLGRVSTQLLALARADEAPARPAKDEAIDLGSLVSELVAERVPQSLDAGVEIHVDRPDDLVAIRGDDVLVGELVANLIDNAIRYNHRGGSVIARIEPGDKVVRLEVEDTGPGIPPEQRERVFERFYRIPSSDGITGSGLGLAIVRAACDRIGASISLSEGMSGSGLLAVVTFRSP